MLLGNLTPTKTILFLPCSHSFIHVTTLTIFGENMNDQPFPFLGSSICSPPPGEGISMVLHRGAGTQQATPHSLFNFCGTAPSSRLFILSSPLYMEPVYPGVPLSSSSWDDNGPCRLHWTGWSTYKGLPMMAATHVTFLLSGLGQTGIQWSWLGSHRGPFYPTAANPLEWCPAVMFMYQASDSGLEILSMLCKCHTVGTTSQCRHLSVTSSMTV
jgi:hypothetical protein